ncbi:hypothetical protein CsSME_00031422 [Camellia sinensis var. sinensis]
MVTKNFIVDLNKPLVSQVGHLGEAYEEWVHQPVVSKEGPRLFENDILEGGFGGFFSRLKWFGVSGAWCSASALSFGFGWFALTKGGLVQEIHSGTPLREGASTLEGDIWVTVKRRRKQEEVTEWCKQRLSMFRGEAKEARPWVVLDGNGGVCVSG